MMKSKKMIASKAKKEAEEFDFDPLAMPGAMPRDDMAFKRSAPKTNHTVEIEDINKPIEWFRKF